MKQQGKLVRAGGAVASAWKVWRGSIRSLGAEAWERSFLAEGLKGAGYFPPEHAARVVFAGDSLTQAWPLDELFPGEDVINAGVGGDLLSQIRERWRRDVLAKNAGIVHLLGGSNNIVRGYSLGFMQRDYGRLAQLSEVSRMRMVIGLLPPMRGNRARLNDRIRQMNEWLTSFARAPQFVTADYYSALADSNGELRAELAQLLPNGKLDTEHLNRAAYELLTPIARQAIAQLKGVAAGA